MKKTSMTPSAAARIQSHADRSGSNAGFKARAQSAAAKPQGVAKPAPAPSAKGPKGK